VIERGRLVGMGSGPACYGEGKLYWAKQWAAEHEVALDQAAAYADNWSDRSLLEHVGRAVVVHPRGRLLRLARSRGWDIVRPRRPERPKSNGSITLSRGRGGDA
jgi:phosphoserine phosphatase